MSTEARNSAPATAVEVRGARVHNLQGIDIDVPLNTLVAIAGVSGSGKSSLAMGVLYAEGSRRYIEALSTYTRRRMAQAARADVDTVRHIPAALALRQRPGVPGVRSTFGTSTELLNVIRLMFSRLASHLCPNGHRQEPTLNVAAEEPFDCPECGETVQAPGAEELAFNSGGACPRCEGIGTIREVDDASLIRDPDMSIDDGTVIPWQMFGFNVQPQIAREFGVRTDMPWRDLEDWEHDIVFTGPEEKKHITVTSKKGLHDLDFTFRNARLTVTEELKRADNEKRFARVSRFLSERVCPDCHGTRLSQTARAPRIGELGLAEATAMTLDELVDWAADVPDGLPTPMQPMARALVDTLLGMARRLLNLGLGYLGLDRAGSSLSTGERQRVQLSRAVRNETTGVLYVLDEPSIGLHPSNIKGLQGVITDLLDEGNSVVMVDHDPLVLRAADHLIEIGPGSGRDGGTVVATGTVADLDNHPESRIGPYLTGCAETLVRESAAASATFEHGRIRLRTAPIHTVHTLDAEIPRQRLTVVTGVSGSGKTTLVLDSLVPALKAADDRSRPDHVREIDAEGIDRVNVVDATPIGINVRSTVATYSGVLDDLRRTYARLDSAKNAGLKAGDFSYNTGTLRCPKCEGTGEITLDVQFLPDVDIPCPDCEGRRFSPDADEHCRASDADGRPLSLPDLLAMTVAEALPHLGDIRKVHARLRALQDVGLGYLTLHEATPALSGGEAQRLKLATELGKSQQHTLFVFDEPTVGLHPEDVRVLVRVFQQLLDQGGTVLVIEHDLDMIANADWIIDLGPGGGHDGGRIVATGTPGQVADAAHSVTGEYLRAHLQPDSAE
ncbi:excinuclease ABC subunit A [Brevibacterium linens]|uniref:UvrABC system protein A n=1 Tax=Brevibacterium linens TaxID=1703 RepID=A0A2H1KCQ0_BRELN|nr:excinuclease ABC subunit A [Brevibacterium linens]SMX97577.1 excinuclease ABC subunit A [Brevibacterium linens]